MSSTVGIYSEVNELFIKTKVTQKFKNETDNPLELKIYINKIQKILFSSFSAKIGDSIEVKSKVIKKEKAETKYSDSIASGNAAIFVSNDPTNSNRIIINMGNIPPKQEVIFISEFLQFIETSDLYEFELFRNLPIFSSKDSLSQYSEIKGTIEINTKEEINKIEKNILIPNKLFIIEEKYLDESKCNYLIKYEYKNLDHLNSLYNSENYIPSNKISFKIIAKNKNICFYQESTKEKEINYINQYKFKPKENIENNNNILSPSLFIFLIDQSGSMYGHSMEVASKALILFLQSLPAGSYYQIIGFGSKYQKYDLKPKEYTQNNIKESIKFIETLQADKGGTNIFDPLKDIYKSKSDYDKINLPKNIFLLTDGEINNKKDTLNIIEENSNEFFVFSIGIGSYFDKDLIQNAGILGKGNYNFCSDIKDLNRVIVNEIKNSSKSYIYDFELKSNLDNNNIYKINDKISTIKENQIVNTKYIVENKEDKINTIASSIKYKVYNKKEKKAEEINEKYEINPVEIQAGEELSKLIIYDYIINKNLTQEEKTKLSLKYQILTDFTSLFAEVELSEKITEEMKKEIIGDKESNIIPIKKSSYSKNNNWEDNVYDNYKVGNAMAMDDIYSKAKSLEKESYSFGKSGAELPKKSGAIGGFFKSIGNSIAGLFSKKKYYTESKPNYISNEDNDDLGACPDDYGSYERDMVYEKNDEEFDYDLENEIVSSNNVNNNNNNNNNNINNNNKENKKDLNVKDIINEQNFVEGYWEITENTKKIKEKYEKEFKSLKELKEKNISDNVAITILIIIFINKEHSELLSELFMIIEKAKNFIKINTNDSYENIIKEIGI